MKDDIKIKGEYTINGIKQHNNVGSIVITNLLNNWLYDTGDDNSAVAFVFGNGTPSDSGLGNQLFSKVITSRTKGNISLQARIQLNKDECNFDIKEIGIIDSSNRLLSYAIVDISKNDTLILNITYTLKVE